MSKGEGRSIVIKFTDDITTEDIGANKSAFTVSGKEYKYVNGPLLDKEYVIDKVERYGVAPIWKIEEELTLDYETLGAFWTDGEVVMPNTFFDLHLTENSFKLERLDSAPTENNTRHFIRFNVDLTNIDILTFEGSMSNRSWISSAVWIDGEVVWESSGNFERTENSIDVSSYSGACDIDFGLFTRNPTGVRGTVEFYTVKIDGSLLIPGEPSYVGFKTHTFDKINSSNQLRIRWLEDKPTGTNITIEYTTGTIQGEWIEVSNGEVITSDTNLWFRVTLETTDTSVTPTLQDLWIEESDAPQDKIRIVMDDYSRFPTVEGDLTVEYDASLGNLAGSGGAVESFIETFTPTGLIPEPNPGIEESVTVAPAELTVDFIPIAYINAYDEDEGNTITVAPATLEVELIHTSIINP